MTKKTQAKTQASDWLEHIKTWQQSGQSQRSYCLEHNISYHCFIYWRRKQDNAPSSQPTHSFVPVTLNAERPEGLTLTLPNGAILHGIETGNINTVCHLLDILR